jgi:hypothetical protein
MKGYKLGEKGGQWNVKNVNRQIKKNYAYVLG